MLSVLIEGTVHAAPVQRVSRTGAPYITVRVRCADEAGESLLCSCVAFSETAQDALSGLAVGESVALAGHASINRWERDGTQHVGLRVTVARAMSVYAAGQRRRAASTQEQPEPLNH